MQNLRVTLIFHEEQYLPVITWNKKHLSKQVVPITNTLEKRVFATTSCKGLWIVSFQTKLETAWYTLVCSSVFEILDIKRRNKYCLCEGNLVFYMQILVWHGKVKFCCEKQQFYNVDYVFAYLYDGHKNNFRLKFRSSFNLA